MKNFDRILLIAVLVCMISSVAFLFEYDTRLDRAKTELAEAKALIIEYQETDIDELKTELVDAQNELNGYKFAEDALEEGQWYE